MSWPADLLGNVSEVVTGSTPSKKKPEYYGDIIPFITPSELNDGEISNPKVYLSNEGAEVARILPVDSVLVCCIGSLGKVGYARKEMATNQQINSLIFDTSKVYPRFGYHYCKTLKPLLDHIAPSTTVAIVNKSRFSELSIPLPPIKEQKCIAAILDKADAIRRKRQQAIDLTDQLLRSVFLDMFGDPVTNPKGWPEDRLINLISSKLQNGAYYPKEEYSDDGVEMVHMSDVFYDVIQRGSLKRVLATENDIEKYKLSSEDLLISRRSLTYEGAAKPSLIPLSSDPLMFESSMIRISPDMNTVLTRYLFQYLSDPSIKTHFVRKYVTGATIKGISQKNLENIRVLVPPIELQRRFVGLIERISAKIEKYKINVSILDQLVASLTYRAFRGELTNQTKAA